MSSGSPSWFRSTPRAASVGSHGPDVKTTASPSCALTFARNSSSNAPGKIFSCFSRSVPVILKNERPAPPASFTMSSYLRSCVPVIPAPPGIVIAAPTPPSLRAPSAITLRGERAWMAEVSMSSRPKRRSGLSEPKRLMASRKVSRGKGVRISVPRHSFHRARNRPSTASNTSSSLTKLISRSIWVCSGWRSARRSSSRRQRASWK